MEPTLQFTRMTPALWDRLVPQPWQDRFVQKLWRARVCLRSRRAA